jgi:peptide/nickel transport system permease protein
MRRPKFNFGFCFITILLIASFLYEPILSNIVKNVDVIYEGVTPITSAPFSPLEVFPLGTDRVGTPLWVYVVQGAKYTILLGVLISLLQVLISCAIVIVFYQYLKKIRPLIEGLVETMIYIPAAAIAFLLIFPIRFSIYPTDEFIKYLSIQVLMLTIIGIPPLISVLIKEMERLLKEEYVIVARTIGAKGWYLFRTHILKNMYPRLILLFFQRIVQVLILFVHLGFLDIFLGGAIEKEVKGEIRLFSLSNEWAGNIGKSYYEIMLSPWLIFVPLLFLSLTILSFNLIISTLQEYFLKYNNNILSASRKKEKIASGIYKIEKQHFKLLKSPDSQKLKPPL